MVEVVNRHCPSKVRFHGGRHDDVYIDREARKEAGLLQRRLPRRAQYRSDKYEFDDGMPGRELPDLDDEEERKAAWAFTRERQAEAERKRLAGVRAALDAAGEGRLRALVRSEQSFERLDVAIAERGAAAPPLSGAHS